MQQALPFKACHGQMTHKAVAVEAELTIQTTADEFLAGHIAAESAGGCAEIGQVSCATTAAGEHLYIYLQHFPLLSMM